MYSIIINTNKSNTKKYCFHILSSNINDNTCKKLTLLEKELSSIYPSEIKIYHINDNLFYDYNIPKHEGSYNAYLRLMLASILSKDIKKCLYLDVDMLVLGDISELFDLDLKDKVFAAVFILKHPWPNLNSKDSSEIFYIYGSHFNSGLMLINLDAWREKNIESRSLSFIKNYYVPYAVDEYVLNAILSKDDIFSLKLEWNFLIGFRRLYLNNDLFFNKEEGDKYKIICYSKEEFEKAFKKIKILHYTYLYMPKPWENVYSFIDDDYNLVYYEFYDAWWDMALKTPIYGEHFAKKKREYEKKSLLTYAQAMSKKIKALEKKTIENNVFMKECLTNGACDRVKNHLNYKIGRVLIDNFTVLKILLIPFKLIYVIMIHKISSFIYKILMQNNPSLKLLPLEKYADYEEAMRIKSFFSYRLGKLFLKNPLSFLFKIKTIKKGNK
ncbi:glycosyltransferase family 8 protein, partial [Campylobacter jejuni]